MQYKRIVMLTMFILCLLAVGSVSAADNTESDIVGVDNNVLIGEDPNFLNLPQMVDNDEIAVGATLTPADAGNLTYTSSDENVAKVVEGKIVAVGGGSAVITVSFAGDDAYIAAENKTIDVTVSKLNATLTVPDVAVYNASKNVVVTLKDMYGNPISDLNVKVRVGELAKTMRTDENGQVALNVSSLEPGRYKVSAKSASSDAYNWAPKIGAVAYVCDGKVNTTLIIQDAAIYNSTNHFVVATLKDTYGYAISGLNVKVRAGSIAKTMKTDEKGQVALDISGLEPGTYKVTAKSASSDVYTWAPHVNGVAYVTDGKIDTVLDVPNVAIIAGNGSVVATLKDIYGNAVRNVNVNIAVGDLAKTMKTDKNGQVSLDISSLEAGNYTVTVKSASSDVYNWADHVKATALVCEDKIDTVLTADDVVATYRSEDTIVATLKDAVGNPLRGFNVQMVVDSRYFDIQKTNANGQAAFRLFLMDLGNHTAVFKSASSDIYTWAPRIKAKITIIEAE